MKPLTITVPADGSHFEHTRARDYIARFMGDGRKSGLRNGVIYDNPAAPAERSIVYHTAAGNVIVRRIP